MAKGVLPHAADRPHPARNPEDKYEVTPLELFFDLVFVFGISQLSHHWLEHLTWRGTAEVVVLLLARAPQADRRATPRRRRISGGTGTTNTARPSRPPRTSTRSTGSRRSFLDDPAGCRVPRSPQRD